MSKNAYKKLFMVVLEKCMVGLWERDAILCGLTGGEGVVSDQERDG